VARPLRASALGLVHSVVIEDLVTAFRRGVAGVNGRRNKMGFMFDHDDVHKKTA
jgi:hypothetical protein